MSVKSNNLVLMADSVQTLKGRLNVRAPLDGQGSTAPTVIKVNQIDICLHAWENVWHVLHNINKKSLSKNAAVICKRFMLQDHEANFNLSKKKIKLS